MKYITEYRDKELAKKLVADIAKEARADKNYRLMEFCGGHTHVISRYGLEGILPKKRPHDSRARLSGVRYADRQNRLCN